MGLFVFFIYVHLTLAPHVRCLKTQYGSQQGHHHRCERVKRFLSSSSSVAIIRMEVLAVFWEAPRRVAVGRELGKAISVVRWRLVQIWHAAEKELSLPSETKQQIPFRPYTLPWGDPLWKAKLEDMSMTLHLGPFDLCQAEVGHRKPHLH